MLDLDACHADCLPYVLQGAAPDDVEEIVADLRESDRFEFAAFGHIPAWGKVVPTLASDVYTAHLGARPVFVFGTVELAPGVRQLFGFGTPRTRRVVPCVTRFTNTYWLPVMAEEGVRRIQVHVPQESTASLHWLQSLGMRVECEMTDYAVNGATMLQLAFTRKEFNQYVHFRQEKLGTRVCGASSGRASEDECGHSEGSGR